MGRPVVVSAGLIALDVVLQEGRPTYVQAGGSAGNVLAGLADHGWHAVPAVGFDEDAASRIVRADLRSVGAAAGDAGPLPGAPAIVIGLLGVAGSAGPGCAFIMARRAQPLDESDAQRVIRAVPDAQVFYFDRAWPGTLRLARYYRERGALVMFEPASCRDREAFEAAAALAHVHKRSAAIGAAWLLPRATSVLEIETRGAAGLRYRRHGWNWRELPAIAAPEVVDATGCGDWCTTGILEMLGRDGAPGLLDAGPEEITAALRYGQALAAWNCAFSGARGGMYAQPRERRRAEVAALLAG